VVDKLDLGPILFKRLKVQGTTLRSRSSEYRANLLQRFKDEALEGIRKAGCEIYKVGPLSFMIVTLLELIYDEDRPFLGKILWKRPK
jgi:hypothetical protein